MAYLSGRLVQSIFPANGSTGFNLNGVIKITFSVDINVLTVNAGTIKLIDSTSGALIAASVSMDPAAPTRTATLDPTSQLTPNTRYQVIVVGGANGVRGVNISGDGGQYLVTNFSSDFVTTSVGQLAAPTQLIPNNLSIVDDLSITFQWEAVSSASVYEFQLDTTQDFNSVAFQNNSVSGNTYNPILVPSLPNNISANYYWRVRAIDEDGNPGLWSTVNQIYVNFGNQSGNVDEYDFINPTYTPFLIVKDTFPYIGSAENDAVSSIIVSFSSPIKQSTVSSSAFVVRKREIGLSAISVLSGTLEVDSNKIIFTPSESIAQGCEYTVYISADIEGTGGQILEADSSFKFMTVISPYYSSIDLIRTELGEFISAIEDIDISKIIYSASQYADQIAFQEYGSTNDGFMGERQQETTNEIFYNEFVKYESSIRVLSRTLLYHASTHNSLKRLGDLQTSGSSSMVPDVSVTVKRLENLRNMWMKKLCEGTGTTVYPVSAILGEKKDPWLWARNKV